jgi:hypothetical protein
MQDLPKHELHVNPDPLQALYDCDSSLPDLYVFKLHLLPVRLLLRPSERVLQGLHVSLCPVFGQQNLRAMRGDVLLRIQIKALQDLRRLLQQM